MASLDLVNVQKSFGPVKILHDISIGLKDGEFLVLVGPSGCGKSTLMNIIAGLEEPSGGRLRLEGRDITTSRRRTATSRWCSSPTRCTRT
jgi:multiple sugar transport system ATP-binding protein